MIKVWVRVPGVSVLSEVSPSARWFQCRSKKEGLCCKTLLFKVWAAGWTMGTWELMSPTACQIQTPCVSLLLSNSQVVHEKRCWGEQNACSGSLVDMPDGSVGWKVAFHLWSCCSRKSVTSLLPLNTCLCQNSIFSRCYIRRMVGKWFSFIQKFY